MPPSLGWRGGGVTDRLGGGGVGPGDVGVGSGLGAVGGAVTTGGWLDGVALWSGWLRPQAATVRLATSRAAATVRVGRMVLILFWTPEVPGVPLRWITQRQVRNVDRQHVE